MDDVHKLRIRGIQPVRPTHTVEQRTRRIQPGDASHSAAYEAAKKPGSIKTSKKVVFGSDVPSGVARGMSAQTGPHHVDLVPGDSWNAAFKTDSAFLQSRQYNCTW